MTSLPATEEPWDRIAVWVFDLDNTLYPAACKLFDQVDRRMGAFIAEEFDLDADTARRMQKRYFHEDGTTLRGLMRHHGTDPTRFLDYVHEIDLTAMPADPLLEAALGRLPGRKLVFTNGSAAHADRVLGKLGIAEHFEAVVDIVASDYVPKPEPAAYDRLVERFSIDPSRAVMVEDIAANLEPAHRLGMTTVWLRHADDWAHRPVDHPFVDHVIADLPAWLADLAGLSAARAS
jgi:putative hydrolase of the HAD superfamily